MVIEIFKEKFLDRWFNVVKGKQVGLNTDEASIEKHMINQKVCELEVKKDWQILELFAGIGLTSYLYSKAGKEVHCIEKDKAIFELLKENLTEISNIILHNDNNINVMKVMVDKQMKFSLADLDPFNNVYFQFPLAMQLIDNGILMVTSGELFAIQRKVAIKKYGEYKLNNSWEFPELVLLPWLIAGAKSMNKEIRLKHLYVYPTSARFLFEVGDYHVSKELEVWLKDRKKYLGWLGKRSIKSKSLSDFFKVKESV